MKTLWSHSAIAICISFLLPFAINHQIAAQTAGADIFIDLRVDESLNQSQVINLLDLTSNSSKGPKLFDFFLQNKNNELRAEDLYLNIEFSSDQRGLLIDLYQKQGLPFSMDAGQQVHATNNTLAQNIPGISENIEFDGGLTAEGEEFLNKLEGSTKLPPGRYLIEVSVTQFRNSQNGGELAGVDAVATAELGGNIADDFRDIFLTSPGDVVGAGTEITNPYPEFRWEGSVNTQYRLIVVEAKGQDSPESLIQGALSTNPVINRGQGGNSNAGSLLEYEMVDARINNTSFQYPPSGVQRLEEEKLYYWQVFAEFRSSSGTETRNSEIWSFLLKGQGAGLSLGSGSDLGTTLNELIESGNINQLKGQLKQLQKQGFKLSAIEIDGQLITGPAMLQQLIEFANKIENGDVTVVNN